MGVSVVIPTHNRAHTILRAVHSALGAIGTQDEIIVVDDGSTDDTEGTLAPVRHRIRYIRIAQGGAGNARNVGIEHASKPLIAFLDSDDAWLPYKLTLQKAVMSQNPDLVFCCSNFLLRMPDGDSPSYLERWWIPGTRITDVFGRGFPFNTTVLHANPAPNVQLHLCDLYQAIMHDGVVCLITLMYRRDKAPDVRFPEDLPTYEDWEFSARLARRGLGAYLDCDTAINYGHDGPRLTNANRFTCATTRLKVMKRLWGSDEAFLSQHEADYLKVWSNLCLETANWLIRNGRSREARVYLRHVSDAPLATRVLAMLPISASMATAARRCVRVIREKLPTRIQPYS
jgi:glycosyltransferase involved in cell wall biosynthesis